MKKDEEDAKKRQASVQVLSRFHKPVCRCSRFHKRKCPAAWPCCFLLKANAALL